MEKQYSEQDLRYAAQLREEIHAEVLARAREVCPQVDAVADPYPVEAYFQWSWDYPGAWYALVAIPEGTGSRAEFVADLVRATLAQYRETGRAEEPSPEKEKEEAAAPAGEEDAFLRDLLAPYPRLEVEYSIVEGEPSSCRGCEAHRLALGRAFQKHSGNGGNWRYDLVRARGRQVGVSALFAPPGEGRELNYRGAFRFPPQGGGYSDAEFDAVNAALFPKGTDGLEVCEWTTDWSDYFDEGHEWWGALCLTVYDRAMDRFVVILASATD